MQRYTNRKAGQKVPRIFLQDWLRQATFRARKYVMRISAKTFQLFSVLLFSDERQRKSG